MLRLKFYRTKDWPGFSVDYLLEVLSEDGLSDKQFEENVMNEHYCGSQDFICEVNGRRVLGGDKIPGGIPTNFVMCVMNNAFYDVLDKGTGQFNLYEGSGSRNIVSIIKKGDCIVLNMERPLAFKQFKNDVTNLAQAVEEVIKFKNEYLGIWRQALRTLRPDKEVDVMDHRIYQTSFIMNHRFYPNVPAEDGKLVSAGEWIKIAPTEWRNSTLWFPLEEKWSEFKKQHNTTDEDVKKAIAEEEEKDKKMKKKWWKIF